MFTFTIKSYFPGLPNLGAQIGFAQNQYTAAQTDLKYPLSEEQKASYFLKLPSVISCVQHDPYLKIRHYPFHL